MTPQLTLKSIAYQISDHYVSSQEVDVLYNAPLGYTGKTMGIKSRYYFDKETVAHGVACAAQKAVSAASTKLCRINFERSYRNSTY